MLSQRLLVVLREYWKSLRPLPWLFPGLIPGRPLTRSSVQRVFYQARDAAGITKKVSVHSLRHSFATHLLESGVHIRKIQLLLGHKSLGSTQVYTHVAGDYLESTPSPLDLLPDLDSEPPREGLRHALPGGSRGRLRAPQAGASRHLPRLHPSATTAEPPPGTRRLGHHQLPHRRPGGPSPTVRSLWTRGDLLQLVPGSQMPRARS